MGFLARLFSGSGASGDDADGATTTLTCDSCGCELDEEDMEEGQCPECYNSEYSGPKYCCGAIYEEGEDDCRSCGEPL